MKFSTPDNDNDKRSNRNGVAHYKSGWWYNNCTWINIPPNVAGLGVLFSEMKIRPKDCITQ